MNGVKGDTVAPVDKLPVRWYAMVYNATGYADEARNMLLNLEEGKYQVKLIPVDQGENLPEVLDHKSRNKINKLMEETEQPNSLKIIWLPITWNLKNSGAIATINRTMFETDTIPTDWVRTFNHIDEIWVPSQFNVKTFSQAGVSRDKLFVIPGGIDPDIFSADITPMSWPEKMGFNFFSVFEWMYRKGWDVLLKAYLTEFNKNDDVALILKVNTYFTPMDKIQRQMYDYIRSHGFSLENIPNIFLIDKHFTGGEMAALYAACDAFILPSRGEGWGRPYMEAMAMGLPTIGTRWSGQTEFMNDDNSYLIDIDGLEHVPPTVDIYYLYRGHRWARPSVEHTMALMRQVYENREQAREKGGKARQDIIEKWSWQKAAEKVEQRLDSYRR